MAGERSTTRCIDTLDGEGGRGDLAVTTPVSTVPLPATLPVFGASVLALGAIG